MPSIFEVIRKAASLAWMLPHFDLRLRRTPHGGSGTDHGSVAQAELLKLQQNGQFPKLNNIQFITTDKAKSSRGGGKVSVL